jgi:hypothetical protein
MAIRSTVGHSSRKNGELLMNKDQMQSRWKEHFEQHLYEEDVRDQPDPNKSTLEMVELQTISEP